MCFLASNTRRNTFLASEWYIVMRACRNLFLTHDKLADFGLDSISEEEYGLIYMKSELGGLPIRWMAIEAFRDGEFSTSSDVWSSHWEIASLGESH